MYEKFVAFMVQFKDIATTIAGFIPLVFVVIDEIQKWIAGGAQNWLNLIVAVVVAVIGWFTGKGKPVPTT